MPLLREQDLRQIEQTLYTPVESELVARRILRVNTNYSKFARAIGYHYYERRGSAKILAMGAGAKDVPFVGEDGGEVISKVYDIVSGIRYTMKEIEASQFRGTQTNVPSVRLDMLRVETARRFIAETENRIVLVGDADHKIQGVLNATGITSEDVAQGAFSGTAAQKRQWVNKTPQEILKDIRHAKTTARQKGLFNPDTLVLPPDQFDMLDQPYSNESTMTIRNWLSSQGVNFPKVFSAKELGKDYNGFATVDCMLVMDSNPTILEIAVTREMELLNPVYDIVGNSEQAVLESLAGAIIRHPKAIYVGKGI
jgi:hypothetical protein